MAESLKRDKTAGTQEMAHGRHLLRISLALLYLGIAVLLVPEGLSGSNVSRLLLYLGLFVSTDMIANGVLDLIAERNQSHVSRGGAGPEARPGKAW